MKLKTLTQQKQIEKTLTTKHFELVKKLLLPLKTIIYYLLKQIDAVLVFLSSISQEFPTVTSPQKGRLFRQSLTRRQKISKRKKKIQINGSTKKRLNHVLSLPVLESSKRGFVYIETFLQTKFPKNLIQLLGK